MTEPLDILAIMAHPDDAELLCGGAQAVAAYTPIPASIPLWAIFTAMAMAIVTGVLFGIAPAYRASRLDPITALRYE